MSAPPPPRIEIVTLRDPDASTEVWLFIDGEQVSFEENHIDAGAGYEWSDWVASRASDIASASDKVAALLYGMAVDPPGDEYIDDMPDDEDERARQLDERIEWYRTLPQRQAQCPHPAEERVVFSQFRRQEICRACELVVPMKDDK
jgi:hypothetical protein